MGYCTMHYQRSKKGSDLSAPKLGTTQRANCSVKNCETVSKSKGLCVLHYSRSRKGADLNAPRKGFFTKCTAPGCDRPHDRRGFCTTHMYRLEAGLDMDAPIKKRRPATPGEWSPWRLESNGYIRRFKYDSGQFLSELQHRFVMSESLGRPLEKGETVHHINGDRSDNRIENLQLRQGNRGMGSKFTCQDCGSHNVKAVSLD